MKNPPLREVVTRVIMDDILARYLVANRVSDIPGSIVTSRSIDPSIMSLLSSVSWDKGGHPHDGRRGILLRSDQTTRVSRCQFRHHRGHIEDTDALVRRNISWLTKHRDIIRVVRATVLSQDKRKHDFSLFLHLPVILGDRIFLISTRRETLLLWRRVRRKRSHTKFRTMKDE